MNRPTSGQLAATITLTTTGLLLWFVLGPSWVGRQRFGAYSIAGFVVAAVAVLAALVGSMLVERRRRRDRAVAMWRRKVAEVEGMLLQRVSSLEQAADAATDPSP